MTTYPSRIIGWGDSITRSPLSGLLGGSSLSQASWLSNGVMRTLGYVELAANVAIGGSKVSEWISYYPTYIQPYTDADVVVGCIGVNDIAAGRTMAQIQADFNTLYGLMLADPTPRRIVFGTIPPSALYPAQHQTFNEWLWFWCQERDIDVIDLWPTVLNPTDGTWVAGTDKAGDGIHPSLATGEKAATIFANYLLGYPSRAVVPFGGRLDSAVDLTQLVPDPSFGTALSASLPKGFSAQVAVPGTVTASLVDATADGLAGNWLTVDVAAMTNAQAYYIKKQVTLANLGTIGDKFDFGFRVRTGVAAGGSALSNLVYRCWVQFTGASVGFGIGAPYSSLTEGWSLEHNGLYRTRDSVIPSGTTDATVYIYINAPSGSGAGRVQFNGLSLRNLTRPVGYPTFPW